MKNKDLTKFYDGVYKKGIEKHYAKLIGYKGGLPGEDQAVFDSANWKGKTVLEAGCGEGILSFEIAKAGAKKVVGIDFSPEGIKNAREKHNLKNLEFFAEDLLKHKGKYDVIISLGTVEHMDNPLRALRKIKKMLNAGGTMIITSPNWTNPRGYILQTLYHLFKAPITLADLHYFTPINYMEFAKKLNMKLSWQTIDDDWSQGQKMLRDLERRLPNVLRDAKLLNKKENIKSLLKWLEKCVIPFDNKLPQSGALGLYIFIKINE